MERMAGIVAMALPELVTLVKHGKVSIELAQELCRLPESAQREILANNLREIRHIARSLRRIRLDGDSPRCLCCGRSLEKPGVTDHHDGADVVHEATRGEQ